MACQGDALDLAFVVLKERATRPMSEPALRSRERIVLIAAVDASERAATVLSTIAGLAQRVPGAEIHLVHVVDAIDPAAVTLGGSVLSQPSAQLLLEEGRRLLRGHMRALSSQLGALVRVTGHVAVGPAWREVLQAAVDLDAAVVVIGSKRAGAIERVLLGSAAQTIVQRSPVPVLVAHDREPHANLLAPACPRCLALQRSTGGELLWCDEHLQHPSRAHVITEQEP